MANAAALTLSAAALLRLLSPVAALATDCSFTLADQSNWSARMGFYMDLENTPAGRSSFCRLKTMTIALGVADGSQWRFSIAHPRWKLDHDYTAKAVIAPPRCELYLDGRRLGQATCALAGLPDRDLRANSVPSWAAGAGDYLPTQSSVEAASSDGTAVAEKFAAAARPLPLMLLAPASNSRSVAFRYAAGTVLTVTAVFRLTAASADPRTYAPYVDAYGQSIHASFPGKIQNDADLRAASVEEQTKLAAWGVPTGYDAWGGVAGAGWQDQPTGFFHVVQRNNVWWLISPAGNPCFYIGLDTGPLTTGNNTPITGREWEFAALPPRSAPYNSAWSSGDWGNQGIASVSFDTWNMIRKYGDAWRTTAGNLAVQRLKSWAFSGFGKWSGDAGSLPMLPVLDGRDVPILARHADIFDPKVRELLRAALRQQMQGRVNDASILGWSYGSEYNEIVTPDEVPSILAMGATVPAKRALVDEALRAIYGKNAGAMAAAWGLARATGVRAADLYGAMPVPPAADIETLREYYADRYYEFIYRTVKDIDPNHLYFGSWIVPGWWVNASDWRLMAAHSDVMGYDRYAPAFEDERLRRLVISAGKPVFLGEFSFPPSYNLMRGYQAYAEASARDDADAGAQYRTTLEAAARNPWCVGVAWFEYRDEPVSGRGLPRQTGRQLVEGEDYAFGMVDVADRPKYDLVEQVRTVNLAAAQRRLALAASGNSR
jgi:hypothetical protein